MKTLRTLSIYILLVMFVMLGSSSSDVYARQLSATSPTLGAADSFAVLAGTAVVNTPTSVITGDVGLSPGVGTDYAGLTPGEVSGTIYAVDDNGPDGIAGNDEGLLTTAKENLVTAYDNIAGQPTTEILSGGDDQLSGQTLVPGVYEFDHATTANLLGTLTLNAQGNANAVWIFKAESDLVTGSGSVVELDNAAQACNVWWLVPSSATLGTESTFAGNILALTSIDDAGDSTIEGRLLARNAQVTLRATTVTRPVCVIAPPGGGGEEEEEEEETTPVISGLPATGGAPIRNHEIPWSLVILGGIGIIPLILGIRDYRQEHSLKK